VTRFLTVDTIEERIDEVLSRKRALFETILSCAEGPQSGGLNQEEIFALFNLHTPRTITEAA
jgi:SNF2 family DNA or RNA helicase